MLRGGREPSCADSVNYVTAQVIGAKLLTGDRESPKSRTHMRQT